MSLVLKLRDRYEYLEKKKDKTDTENKFLEKCETYLINIENEFKKQLDNMYKTSELDIEKEIKLFESICNIEGLDKEKEKYMLIMQINKDKLNTLKKIINNEDKKAPKVDTIA